MNLTIIYVMLNYKQMQRITKLEDKIMCADTTDKIELPLTPTPHIMELLIKAKHFFEHAVLHAQTGNAFDSMISIHSLDNAIEYLLRIIILKSKKKQEKQLTQLN